MTAVPATGSRDTAAARVPVRGLTVLYDADCGLCAFLRDWLVRQPQLVPLELLPAVSAEARRRYPGLDHRATLDEVTVVADSGQVYRSTAAWIVVLWALRAQRPLAHRLATPAGAPFARGAVLAAARWRESRRRGPRSDGRTYRQPDGWTYHPDIGWTFAPPACVGDACATR
ncbi:thiol-disulfide oxidoreductase DCC family protein [Streptomyces griseoviridis]